MAHEIRIWSIGAADEIREIDRTQLDFEARLEDWLERDITILFDDLLVIGRQVDTDLGGCVDLLCIDGNGDLVIVELKRDRTPREIIAQALEYAAWVNDLSSNDVSRIAELRFSAVGGFEEAFRSRFGAELPDTINDDHRIVIVAAIVDARCDRVVKYLSERHGVNINVATFQHFGEKGPGEYFARVFLLEPTQVEYRARTAGASRRRPNLTYEELEKLADERGVGSLYRHLVEGFESHLIKGTTRSSIAFKAALELRGRDIIRKDRKAALEQRIATLGDRAKTVRTVISLLPGESSADEGVCFQVYVQRLKEWLGRCDEEIAAFLPMSREPWCFVPRTRQDWEDWSGFQGYVKSLEEADRFIELVRHGPH